RAGVRVAQGDLADQGHACVQVFVDQVQEVGDGGGRIGRVTGSSVNRRSVRTAPTTAGSASPLDDGDRGDPARAVGVAAGAGAGAGAGGGVAGIEPQALVLVLER
ncbi:hypothetical protein ACWCPX_41075, partial [Streptomyces olivaceoviridis]